MNIFGFNPTTPNYSFGMVGYQPMSNTDLMKALEQIMGVRIPATFGGYTPCVEYTPMTFSPEVGTFRAFRDAMSYGGPDLHPYGGCWNPETNLPSVNYWNEPSSGNFFASLNNRRALGLGTTLPYAESPPTHQAPPLEQQDPGREYLC